MSEKRRLLTENELKFASLYLETRNATRSYAIAYGYKPDDPEQKEKHYNSWSASGSNMLKRDAVQDYLNERMKELDYQRELSDKEIIHELNKIALGGSMYRENTRMDALKTLMQYYGMFGEDEANQNININLGQDLKDAISEQTKDE